MSLSGLNCRTCTAQLKASRGCEGFKVPQKIEGVEVKRCPVKEVTAKSRMCLAAYRYYQDGHLPDPKAGGPFDQCGKMMDAIGFIQSEKDRIERSK